VALEQIQRKRTCRKPEGSCVFLFIQHLTEAATSELNQTTGVKCYEIKRNKNMPQRRTLRNASRHDYRCHVERVRPNADKHATGTTGVTYTVA